MKRTAVILGVAAAMGVLPSVASARVSGQVKPVVVKPAVVKPALVKPAIVRPAVVKPALVRPLPAWSFQLRLSVLRQLRS